VDKVFVKDLLVRGVIGVSERERAQPQDIVVNLTMFLKAARQTISKIVLIIGLFQKLLLLT
jgi:FolB domain-containing protein